MQLLLSRAAAAAAVTRMSIVNHQGKLYAVLGPFSGRVDFKLI